jgi:hypothetical protein
MHVKCGVRGARSGPDLAEKINFWSKPNMA